VRAARRYNRPQNMAGAWTPNSKRWIIAPPDARAEGLARAAGIHPLVASLLLGRGVDGAEAAKAFLQPKLSDLHDPDLLPASRAAAERVSRAVAEGEKIVIYGDYDVDGITGTAILHAVLKMVNADVGFYVPHRLEEGYGLNGQAVRTIAESGAKLMVTVDCGISAVAPVAEARSLGMDVIITDHHTPGDELPEANAIVHPTAGGAAYPNPDIAGAGVALKLAWQVARVLCGAHRVDEPMREFLLEATCMAALGTIADVVPLVGENRAIAMHGLRGLPHVKRPGIRALIESAGLTGERLDAYHVGFVLAPRINAAGRMGHARLAVELLTSADAQRGAEIAGYLAQQNTDRQKVERAIAEQAAAMVIERGLDRPDRRAIVLCSEKWHSGVIGIVASRLVRRFGRPTILIAINGDGVGQGSGRSIRGFHMRDALAACGEHLLSFGGHAMAGGLRVEAGKVDAFAEALLARAAAEISEQQLTPALHIDAETSIAALTHAAVLDIEHMAPFGQGNPAPVVMLRGCELLNEPKRMGRTGTTVGLYLGQNGRSMRAVGFGMGELADALRGVNRVDVAAEPNLNRFNGRTSVELRLKDVRW